MKRLLGFLTNPILVSLIGVAAIAVLVWVLGPLFAFAGAEPLASVTARVITIAVLFLIWAVVVTLRWWRAKRANEAMMGEIAGAGADPAAEAADEEIAILRRRLEEALATLKKARLGGGTGAEHRRLYQLPWYMIIGPPGAGKTTALLNSGLKFPLAESGRAQAFGGVSGTRNCDWWFTEDAVLIDTAGRYTSQDSHDEVDRAGWLGFLAMLKKHRRRRPLNGVLVTLSVMDLLQGSEHDRQRHAQMIRSRLQELHEQLGIRFPVYLLVTKTDLVPGFVEAFEDLGAAQREQVWGATFDYAESDQRLDYAAEFGRESEELRDRLQSRVWARIRQERHPDKRARLFGFPQQFSYLTGKVEQFLADAFEASRYTHSPLLRGVYFTSGTQEGTPIDRLMGSLASNFGIDRGSQAGFSGQPRAYFINHLLRRVVFEEADLAGTNLKLERRLRWVQTGAYAAAVLLALMAAGAWTASYLSNRDFVARVADSTAGVDTALQQLSPDDFRPLSTLDSLDRARNLPGGYAAREQGVPLLMGLGLYQGDKLGGEAVNAYRRLLVSTLLPRIMVRMEQLMLRGSGDADDLYNLLKAYLMLDRPQHFDGDFLGTVIVADWQRNLPRGLDASQIERLLDHLEALLERPAERLPVPIKTELVEDVRRRLALIPVSRHIYNRLKQSREADALPAFNLSDTVGRDAPFVFVRTSGKPINEGVPGFFTFAGYHDFFLPRSRNLAELLTAESWVLGDHGRLPREPSEIDNLVEDIQDVYLGEFLQQWQGFLDDVDLVPFTGPQQAVEVLNVLSSSPSPATRLLQAVARQTYLGRSSLEAPGESGGTESTFAQARRKLTELLQSAGVGSAAAETGLPTRRVDEAFRELRTLVEPPADAPAPITGSLQLVDELKEYMNAIASAADRGNAAFEAAREQAGARTVISRIELEAKRRPQPLRRWLEALAVSSTDITLGGLRAHLNAVWRSEVLPFCTQSIVGRYPVTAGSPQEITLEDFGQFFGPGGIVQRYFDEQLKPFVDTTRARWRWKTGEKGDLGISDNLLVQLQRAHAVRNAFFRDGGGTPKVRFSLTPITMDAEITQFQLNLDGQSTSYRHGPVKATSLEWPGPEPGLVSIQLSPQYANVRSSLIEQGTWSWFRLLGGSDLRQSGRPERYEVTFDVDGRRARYELLASSAVNPFALNDLGRFRCPTKL